MKYLSVRQTSDRWASLLGAYRFFVASNASTEQSGQVARGLYVTTSPNRMTRESRVGSILNPRLITRMEKTNLTIKNVSYGYYTILMRDAKGEA